jgi:integrase
MPINIQCAKCRKRFPRRQNSCPKCGSTERAGYMLDWWADGRRYHKMFETLKAAGEFETEVKSKKDKGEYVSPSRVPLFKEAAAAWLATCADRAEGTYDLYRSHIDRHLLPKFGELRLNQIKPDMIGDWRARLSQSGGTSKWRRPMAKATVRTVVFILRSVLDGAISNRQLASNPVKLVKRPYVRRRIGKREDAGVKPDEILNPDDIRRLLEATAEPRWRTLFTLAATSGARQGELLGLQWSDVTFDGEPQIRIRRSLSWAKGPNADKKTWRLGPTKTEAGVRDVPIDPATAHVLKRWRLAAGRNEHDLVFAGDHGEPLTRWEVLEVGLASALKAAKLKHVTFHSLRHSYASGLIANGAPITEVARRLGHEDVGVTMRVYSHWYANKDSGAASRYTSQLFGEVATK